MAGCVNVIFGNRYHHSWHCGTLSVQMLPSDKVAVLSVLAQHLGSQDLNSTGAMCSSAHLSHKLCQDTPLSHPCGKWWFEWHRCLGYGEVDIQVLQIEHCSSCSGLNPHTKAVLKRDRRIIRLCKERLTGCLKLGFWHQFNFKLHL